VDIGQKLWFGGHQMMQQFILVMLCLIRWSNKYMLAKFSFKFNRKLDPSHQVRKSPELTV
jgi:hypothetical protein